MVQNGVEHGITRLIAETYDLMSRGLGMSDAAIQEVFANWCVSDVSSNLLGILARRLRDNNGDIGAALFDLIVDETTRNGGAKWASIEARELNVPTPTIDVAVAIDMLSDLEEGRAALRKPLGRRPIRYVGRPDLLIDQMKHALRAGLIITLPRNGPVKVFCRYDSTCFLKTLLAYGAARSFVPRCWKRSATPSICGRSYRTCYRIRDSAARLSRDIRT
jgi:6-phosphogluconate dehydrogenase